MPAIDMPLEDLKKYTGRNPLPNDFSQYWDEALVEMNYVEPNVELIKSSFQTKNAECFDLYFTGVGGARIHAQYLKPKHVDKPIGAVLQFHGYSCSAGDWSGKLNYVNAGFAVAALECRGQGGNSQDNGQIVGSTLNGHIVRGLNDSKEKLLFRSIFLDTAQLAKIVMSFAEIDENNICAIGGSQGGGLTIACSGLVPQIKRAVIINPFLSDYKRVWEMDMIHRAYRELREFFKRDDPMHEREDEFFTRLGYIDVQHLAPRIKAEVLMATGLVDDCCPPSTQFAAYNKIISKKSIKIYPDFGHEDLPRFWDLAFNFITDIN